MPATAKVIDFAEPNKALVRFPTEEEQARGIVEVPRKQRIREYIEQGGSREGTEPHQQGMGS